MSSQHGLALKPLSLSIKKSSKSFVQINRGRKVNKLKHKKANVNICRPLMSSSLSIPFSNPFLSHYIVLFEGKFDFIETEMGNDKYEMHLCNHSESFIVALINQEEIDGADKATPV